MIEKHEVPIITRAVGRFIREYVSTAIATISKRLDEFDARIKSVPPGERGEVGPRGERGEPGTFGAKGDPGAVGQQGPDGERGPAGERGADGPDGSRGDKGESGTTGAPGPIGATGPEGKQGIPGEGGLQGNRGDAGLTGAKGDAGEIGDQGVQGERGAVGERGLQGNPGERGATGERGQTGERGAPGAGGSIGERGAAGERGESGEPGRSASLEEIDKSVEREFSKFAVGFERHLQELADRTLQRAIDKMPLPKDGVDGKNGRDALELEDIDASIDDEGFLNLLLKRGDFEKRFRLYIPTVSDKGVYKQGVPYLRQNGVTHNGCFWISQVDNPSEGPGVGSQWRLAVKSGRNGIDGKSIKGDQGIPGPPGKDLRYE